MREWYPWRKKCLESRKKGAILAAKHCCDAGRQPRSSLRSTHTPLDSVPALADVAVIRDAAERRALRARYLAHAGRKAEHSRPPQTENAPTEAEACHSEVRAYPQRGCGDASYSVAIGAQAATVQSNSYPVRVICAGKAKLPQNVPPPRRSTIIVAEFDEST